MTRLTTPLALLAAVFLFAGCGSSSGAGGSTADDAGSQPSASATAEPTKAASLPGDVCTSLSAADVSRAVGGKVTLSPAPGGDCSFQQEDHRAISGGLGVDRNSTAGGGYDTYLSGLNMTMTSADRHDVDRVGEHAAVLIGMPQMGSGENLMAAGAVDKGDHLLTVTLAQGKGESADRLLAVATDLLRLIDDSVG